MSTARTCGTPCITIGPRRRPQRDPDTVPYISHESFKLLRNRSVGYLLSVVIEPVHYSRRSRKRLRCHDRPRFDTTTPRPSPDTVATLTCVQRRRFCGGLVVSVYAPPPIAAYLLATIAQQVDVYHEQSSLHILFFALRTHATASKAQLHMRSGYSLCLFSNENYLTTKKCAET